MQKIKKQLPPVLIHSDPICGMGVKAAETIESLTLICEYVGEVRNVK